MSLSPAFLDELRSRTHLSSLIGKTVKIKRAGREYKACCPFHDEKTPSFTINDDKGFYHCFGCGAHGDAIRWMTDQQGLPFMDAVKELAAAAGMEVPAPDPRAARQAEQRQGLHDVMSAAQGWFESRLASSEGDGARAYLARRGISPAHAKAMGFGFAPDDRNGVARALLQFSKDMLVEAGLLISVDDKEPYDRFRGRLMLPIKDARGRAIAFGGRILGDGTPKYLNSPDTPLFDKGRILYNLHTAAPAARQSGRLVVVEGYMDAVALIGVGIGEVVAPLGTALTEQQIELAWRQVDRPLLCFDGDAAGQRAAMRAATRALPLLRPGHSLDFMTLPAGKDPDDVVREGGRAAFEALLDAREPLVERLWRHELAAERLDTPEERAGLKARLGAHVEAIADAEIRRHYAQAFREKFDAQFFARREAPPFQRRQNSAPPSRGAPFPRWQPTPPAGTEAREIGASGVDPGVLTAIIVGLVRHPRAIDRFHDLLTDLRLAGAAERSLLSALLAIRQPKEGLDAEGILTILAPPDLRSFATSLLRTRALPFSFVSGATKSTAAGTDGVADDEAAVGDLGEAIRLMVELPAIEAAMGAAQRAAEDDLTEENYAEQQRLRSAREGFVQRLKDLMVESDAH